MSRKVFSIIILSCGVLWSSSVRAHPNHHHDKNTPADPFRQLEEVWPTPDEVRLASGAPGPKYWQQKVDYQIDVTLDDEARSLNGVAQITYHNQSPHDLDYLWIQLDQNRFKATSASHLTRTFKGKDDLHYGQLNSRRNINQRNPGVRVDSVTDQVGHSLKTTVVDTMMRVDLPSTLKSNARFRFKIKWRVNILRHKDTYARAGYEDLKSLAEFDRLVKEAKDKLASKAKADDPSKSAEKKAKAEQSSSDKASPKLTPKKEDGVEDEQELPQDLPQRRIYEIAQWYPRLAAYTDVNGWQNKQFLGNGEFTLEFGDFLVRITVPDHMTVTATGELMNPQTVLSTQQRKRLEKASVAETPQWIITPEEARTQSIQAPQTTKTWIFGASQVRDFAFAASNTFIWDAMAYRPKGRKSVLAMSFYPPEAESLWHRYSTHAVVHTLEQYERYTFPYPYPVAISVHGPIFGMEYPMITFNGVRPKLDGTYSKMAKYALIGVIIHEVGHFFFPMVVNSDERQWTWLDEGINSFVQYQAERAWEKDFPSWNGAPDKMIGYMTSKEQMPIMTNSESLLQFSANAYGKPATALSILRETVIGPDLFDQAFKTYAERWRFKRPMPSDFFRTLEDVSGVDLDWFWRGWFYSTAHVDVQIKDLRRLRLKTKDPKRDKAVDQMRDKARSLYIAEIRDEGREQRIDKYTELADFYNRFDPLKVTESEIEEAKKAQKGMIKKHPERAAELQTKGYFYELTLVNKGGVVTPIPLRLKFTNHRQEVRYIPAEVWRKNHKEIKLFLDLEAELESIELDPYHETADAHKEDNYFPQRISDVDSFDLKSWRPPQGLNPMQKSRKWNAQKRAKALKEAETIKIADQAKTAEPTKKQAIEKIDHAEGKYSEIKSKSSETKEPKSFKSIKIPLKKDQAKLTAVDPTDELKPRATPSSSTPSAPNLTTPLIK